MKIKSAAENEAILSNVGHVGEFRIRNSAKAFGILSSGLYANKIRAIIREYSCNAYDSHVEAGKADCPFDVHLPNALEPWFAVRDYGVGLDDNQVVNIFTTYFESTKTETDDLIGGLGLGSKSAFSYTDNFTITAIKAGVKRIYTAFINEQGVPSVAMMMQEDTDEAAGVEIRFAVAENYDFRKFYQEAASVFRTFRTPPTVIGVQDFQPDTVDYQMRDIIPGAHVIKSRYRNNSTAIMGNIAYPLDVPNAEQNLGDVASLLDCGLEIEFGIGELDIQASREGLSYIPETIAAIRAKLTAIRDAVSVRIAADADEITNEWLRAMYVVNQCSSRLTSAAAVHYNTVKPSPLIRPNYHGLSLTEIRVKDEDLKKWNIKLQGFRTTGYSSPRTLKVSQDYSGPQPIPVWDFPVRDNVQFVINTAGKPGAIQRTRYHWNESDDVASGEWYVFVIDPLDKKNPVDTVSFFAALHNPHRAALEVTDLLERPKAEKTDKVRTDPNVMLLQKRNPSGYSWRSRDNDMVWREAGVLSALDANAEYLYIPMVGSTPQMTQTSWTAQTLLEAVQSVALPEFRDLKIYGVRKSDHDTVEALPNWTKFEDFVVKVLSNIDDKIIESLAASQVDSGRHSFYNDDIAKLVDPSSPFVQLVESKKNMDKLACNIDRLHRLEIVYKDQLTAGQDSANKVKAKVVELKQNLSRYPLLDYLNAYADETAVAEYINAIDNSHEGN